MRCVTQAMCLLALASARSAADTATTVEPSAEASIGVTTLREVGVELGIAGGVRINRTLHGSIRAMGMRIRVPGVPEKRISYDVSESGYLLRGIFLSLEGRTTVGSDRLWLALGIGAGRYQEVDDISGFEGDPYYETHPGIDLRAGIALLHSTHESLDVSVGLKTFVGIDGVAFQPSALFGYAFN